MVEQSIAFYSFIFPEGPLTSFELITVWRQIIWYLTQLKPIFSSAYQKTSFFSDFFFFPPLVFALWGMSFMRDKLYLDPPFIEYQGKTKQDESSCIQCLPKTINSPLQKNFYSGDILNMKACLSVAWHYYHVQILV